MNIERIKELSISAYNAVHRKRENGEDYDLYLARCRGAAQAYTELLMKELDLMEDIK